MLHAAVTAQTSAHAALPAPGGTLDWTVTGGIAGMVDGLQLRDLLGDGQELDPARPPDVIISSGGVTLFSGAVTPTERRDAGSGVTTVGLNLSAALQAAGLTGTLPDGAVVQVVLHSIIGAAYATTTQPLLSRLVGQGDPLDNAAEFSATQAGQAVTSDPASARLVLPSSQLTVEVYAVNGVVGAAAVLPGDSVTYRLRLAMPLGTAQAVQVQAVIPGLAAMVAWDGAGGPVLLASGHAALGPASTAGLAPQVVSVVPGVGGPALELDFGNVAPTAGAAPAVIDVLYTAALPAGASTVQATSVEENSFGGVSGSAASADLTAPVPQLLLQTASLNDTGLQSSFFAVGNGSGSPVAFSTDFGQFSGPVTSAALAADPFSDRLANVAAGDLVTFVIAVQNVTAGVLAYGIVLRDTPPAGFVVPTGGPSLVVTTGAGIVLATSGDLFDPAGGLALDPGAPLLGYDATSGSNVALVAFTLLATSGVPASRTMLASTAQVVAFAGSSGGVNLATTAITATTVVATMAPTVALTQTRTDAASPGGPLAVGQTVTLHAAVTLPSGSSQALRIDPVLPDGLALVSATITDVTPGTAGLAAGQASASGFDLGNYTAGSAGTVGIDIVARATGGSGGAVQAVVSAADGTGGRVATAASAQVPVLSPALSMALTGPASLQSGQSGSYTLQLTDAPGAASAYAVQVLENLALGLVIAPGTASVSGSRAGATVGVTASGGLAIGLSELDAGEALTLTFQAQAAAAAGAVLASFAEVDAASLPGGSPANQLAAVQASTSIVGPSAGIAVLNARPQVGHVVTFEVTAILPEGTSPAVGILDHLGDGLTLVPGSIRVVQGGAAGTAPAVSISGQDITLQFGPVDAGAGSEVVIQMKAQVGAVPVGTVLTSTAMVTTGYAPSPAATTTARVADTPPTLTGISPAVATVDTMPIAPFAALALADPDAGQTESVTVTLSDARNGTLTNLGGGAYDPVAGIYTLAGSAALVQAALQGLLFVPTEHQIVAGGQVTTGLAVAVQDGAGGGANAATQVVAANLDAVPVITGGVAGQSTTTTLAALPFAGLLLTDSDVGQVETMTVQGTPGLGSVQGGLGLYDAVTGTYTAQGTTAALTADVQALVFTPSTADTASFSVTLNDGAGGVAQDGTTSVLVVPSADTAGVAQHFMQLPGAQFLTLINGVQTTVEGEQYHGPVSYLQDQLILDTAGPAVIVAHTPDAFIKSFSGFSAIQVLGGRNVVDAGPGSNFVVGGTGDDTFFLDGTHGAVTWDTIQGFHPGDMMTLFGFHAGISSFVWADADGAAGYTGRTIHADLAGTGGVTASLTFAGTTAADTDRYVISTGTVGRVDYLAVTEPR
jgi:fimbrial isopeptide formation D2 family protein